MCLEGTHRLMRQQKKTNDGGVFIAIKKAVQARRCCELESDVWATWTNDKGEKTNMSLVYIRPRILFVYLHKL